MTVSAPRPAQALYRASDARDLDARTIQEHGIPGFELMTRAGAGAFAVLRARWPEAVRIGVLCGPGNNGGDGFVVARLAAEAGLETAVFLLGNRAALTGDADRACAQMEAGGVTLQPMADFRAGEFQVLVDALFGTGLSRPLRGDAAALVSGVNRAAVARLALDIPSGLSADTGQALGATVIADLTVSFIGLKQGLFTGDGPAVCGDIVLDTLEVPQAVYEAVAASALRVNADLLGQPLGPRPARANKGRFGHVLVVGGDHGFAGAARLCAEASARTGAGLTSVATRAEHIAVMVGGRPELMVRAVERSADLRDLLAMASVVAVGPGLGRGAWGAGLLGAVLDSPHPRVLDADALNLMSAGHADWSTARGPACVITPHPGEAARVLGATTAAVESDRFAAVRALVERTGCVVVLKGAGSLVQGPGRRPRVVDAGNPGMASGGMGDLLTGVIASLLAQGLDAMDAAVVGATLHAEAGDAAAAQGERGLLAGDLLPHLRRMAGAL